MNFFKRAASALGSLLTESRRSIFATAVNYFYPIYLFNPKKYYTGWVFAAINFIATQVATIDVGMQVKKGDKWENVDNHPSLDLLKKVNSEFVSSQLFYSVPAWCEAEGNAYWVIFYNQKGEPSEIWPYDSTRVIAHTDPDGFLDGYQLINEAGQISVLLGLEEIIHFKKYNIKNRLRGMGTIEAIRLEADTDMHAGEYSRNFYYNSAVPSGVLETEKGLTREQIEVVREGWNKQYQGVENANKTGILHSGLKYKPTVMNQRDMQYLEQRKYSRDSILAVFGVPPPLLTLEAANLANIQGAEYIFAKYKTKPWMEFIVDNLNEFYLPKWKLNPAQYRFYNKIDPIPENEDLELKKEQAEVNLVVTVNEARAKKGLPSVGTQGDVLYVSNTLVPLGTPPSIGFSSGGTPPAKESKKKIVTKEVMREALQALLTDQTPKSQAIYLDFLEQTKDALLAKLEKAKSFKKLPAIDSTNAFTKLRSIAKRMKITKDTADEMAKLLFENWDDWIGILYNSIKSDAELGMTYGGRTAIARVDAKIEFDLENERAQAWIADTALNDAKSVVGTLKDELRPVIAQAASEGKGAEGVARAIRDSYSNIAPWKSLMLARSELCNGYSQGALEGYRQSEVVEGKEWFTGGNNPCDECLANEDQGSIPLDEDFQSGDDAPGAHPSDECTLLPTMIKE